VSVTQHTYELLAVEDPEGHWELHRGRLREKPTMSFTHNEEMSELGFLFRSQLSSDVYVVRINTGRIKISSDTYYIPDIFVALRNPATGHDDASALETYSVPLPLVVEVGPHQPVDMTLTRRSRSTSRGATGRSGAFTRPSDL
jgi:Uma2 family endonuclease